MTRPLARLGAALALMSLASTVTACAPPTTGVAPPAESSQGPSAPVVDPAPEPSQDAPASADPTCATIIDADVVDDFESLGWSSRADPFSVGELRLDGGLQCLWADFAGPASDHLQLFGWAPISSGEATIAQQSLLDQGWVRHDAADGVYVTESPETTIAADDEGFGMTYLFADGWVKVADTKQGLLLIEWPR